jgi:hypothetical protein
MVLWKLLSPYAAVSIFLVLKLTYVQVSVSNETLA